MLTDYVGWPYGQSDFSARIDIPIGYTGIMDGWRVKLDFHICSIKQVEGGCD